MKIIKNNNKRKLPLIESTSADEKLGTNMSR